MNVPIIPPVNAPQPTSEQHTALAKLIRDHLISDNSKKRRAMFEAMLNLAATPNLSPMLTPLHILRAMNMAVTPKAITNIRCTKNRLNADFARFFDYEEGRTEKWRMYFEDKNYRILFRPNDPPSTGTDYLAEFWAPHRESKYPTHILYPEPCFFKDARNTYLRNPAANSPDDRELFSYLTDWPQLKTTYSYVPSGAVTAMLAIMARFRQWGQEITPKPFLPQDRVPDAPNLIVLGTATSMQAVATLERGLPMYTGLQNTTIAGEEPVEDTETCERGVCLYTKWGTLTRRWHRFPDRIVTVISGHHGRTVDAVAAFLTTPASMPLLAEKLQHPKIFPASFQALFSAEMEETLRGPHITSTAIDRAIDVKEYLNPPPRPSVPGNTQTRP